MSPLKEWSCWEIIKCDKSADCPVCKQAGMSCWEVAKELDDYRSALNICKDCIVYVSRQEQSVLTEEDIKNIIATKKDCLLMTSCPRHEKQD